MKNRHLLKTALLCIGLCLSATSARALELALTFDDPMTEESPQMSYAEVNTRILSALEREKLKVFLFVCGKRVDNELGTQLVSMWDEAGHGIADHGYSHLDFNSPSVSLAEFRADVQANQKVLKRFPRERVPYFRFPFLHEGDTKAKRDGMREFFAKGRVFPGYVSVDASDWAISARLVKAQARGSKAMNKYRDYFIQHILDRVDYYDGLAKKHLKRDVKHTLLLHHNVLNALFLPDLIAALKKHGVKLIDAETAYADPLYRELPEIVPAGQSIVWAMAKAYGDTTLRYPGEDEKYETKGMDRAGL